MQPTPFIPLPYKGGGSFFIEEGLAPLLNTPLGYQHLLITGGEENKRVLEAELMRAGGWEDKQLLKVGWRAYNNRSNLGGKND